MRFNAEIANLLYQSYLGLSNVNRYQLVLIEGGHVDANELRNNFNTSATQPFLGLFASLYNTIGARGGKVVGLVDLPKNANPIIGSGLNFQLNFQVGRVAVNVLNSGRPDWFLLYDRTTNVNYNANGSSVFAVRGSISDLNGNGDMIVDNPDMIIGSAYRVLNIKFGQRL